MRIFQGVVAPTRRGEALCVGEVRNTKVANLDFAAVGCPQEICGFDVTVNDSLIMHWKYARTKVSLPGGRWREKSHDTRALE